MAVPKKKTSKARSRKRRANWNLEMPVIASCSNCGSVKRPHFVCPECGFYKQEVVISPKED